MATELSMTWETFLKEHIAHNSTDSYKYNYLNAYKIEFNRYEDKIILMYAKKATEVEGIPADKVLSDYVDSIIKDDNYTFESNVVMPFIMYLLGKGARFPEEKLIEPNYKRGEKIYAFYKEFYNYKVKGALIDCVAHIVELPLLHAIDWGSVKAETWGTFTGYPSSNMLNKEEEIPTEEHRLSVLKFHSFYLRRKYHCKGDAVDKKKYLKPFRFVKNEKGEDIDLEENEDSEDEDEDEEEEYEEEEYEE